MQENTDAHEIEIKIILKIINVLYILFCQQADKISYAKICNFYEFSHSIVIAFLFYVFVYMCTLYIFIMAYMWKSVDTCGSHFSPCASPQIELRSVVLTAFAC